MRAMVGERGSDGKVWRPLESYLRCVSGLYPGCLRSVSPETPRGGLLQSIVNLNRFVCSTQDMAPFHCGSEREGGSRPGSSHESQANCPFRFQKLMCALPYGLLARKKSLDSAWLVQ